MIVGLIPEEPAEGAKARRDIVLSAYQSLQRRLDRYRQIGITTATAFVPILTFFISTAIKISDGIGLWAKGVYIAFLVFTTVGAALFLCRLLKYFQEMSELVQRCEILAGMHHEDIFGKQPLLFHERFKPTYITGTAEKNPAIECPRGWSDPFIKMALWAILIMGALAVIIVAFIFFSPTGPPPQTG